MAEPGNTTHTNSTIRAIMATVRAPKCSPPNAATASTAVVKIITNQTAKPFKLMLAEVAINSNTRITVVATTAIMVPAASNHRPLKNFGINYQSGSYESMHY